MNWNLRDEIEAKAEEIDDAVNGIREEAYARLAEAKSDMLMVDESAVVDIIEERLSSPPKDRTHSVVGTAGQPYAKVQIDDSFDEHDERFIVLQPQHYYLVGMA